MVRIAASIVPFFLFGALIRPLFDEVNEPAQGSVLECLVIPFIAALVALLTQLINRRLPRLIPAILLFSASLGARHVGGAGSEITSKNVDRVMSCRGQVDRISLEDDPFGGPPRRNLRVRDVENHDGTFSVDYLSMYGPDGPPLPKGIEVMVVGRLQVFDTHMRLEFAVPEAIRVLPTIKTKVALALDHIRQVARRKFSQFMSPRASEVVAQLFLGDREPDPELTAVRQRAGAQHFFAVSGFHLSLLLFLFLSLRSRAGSGSVLVDTMIGGVLFFYCLLVGGEASVFRAFSVAVLALTARHKSRRAHGGWIVLSSGFLAVLTCSEFARSVSFLLSFAAVLGLQFLAAPLLEIRRDDPLDVFLARKTGTSFHRWLKTSLICSTAALLTTSIVSVTVFGSFAPAALLTNIAVAPAMALLIVGGLVSLVIPAFGLVLEPLAMFTEAALAFLATIPGGYMDVPQRSLLTTWALCLVTGTAMVHLPECRKTGRQRWFGALVAAHLLWVFVPGSPSAPTLILVHESGREVLMAMNHRDIVVFEKHETDLPQSLCERIRREILRAGCHPKTARWIDAETTNPPVLWAQPHESGWLFRHLKQPVFWVHTQVRRRGRLPALPAPVAKCLISEGAFGDAWALEDLWRHLGHPPLWVSRPNLKERWEGAAAATPRVVRRLH